MRNHTESSENRSPIDLAPYKELTNAHLAFLAKRILPGTYNPYMVELLQRTKELGLAALARRRKSNFRS